MLNSLEEPLKGISALNLTARERLILALDVPDENQAKQIVTELGDMVSCYKVGLELIMCGVVEWLRENGKDVFLDLKCYDIPNTVASAIKSYSKLGVKFVTIDGNGNGEMIRAGVSAKGPDVKLLWVTALTSLDDEVLKEMGWQTTIDELVESRVRRAIRGGLDGVISSGLEVEMIKNIAYEEDKKDLLIVVPGIRFAGSSHDDHKRTCDPESAIINGAHYIVVGRPISQADYRRAAAEKFVDAIERGLAARSSGSPATV